jgi:Rrf2 family protein
MQITRETDYAIRCVYYLAGKLDEVINADEISKELHVPKSFLSKILQKLSKASLVKPYRGIKGGFALARHPSKISLFDVIKAIQGPIIINICAVDQKACRLSDTCVIHPVWIDIREQVETMLKKKNFADLLAS